MSCNLGFVDLKCVMAIMDGIYMEIILRDKIAKCLDMNSDRLFGRI